MTVAAIFIGAMIVCMGAICVIGAIANHYDMKGKK